MGSSSPGSHSSTFDAIQARISTARAAEATPLSSVFAGADATLIDELSTITDALRPQLYDLSHTIHNAAEVAFEETISAATCVDLLQKHRITVQQGIGDLPTAFRAEIGSGERTVGICAEYDALPGIGHACGHNVIAAMGVGAFLALAELHTKHPLPGRVVLIGTPAEEGHSGKELLIRQGAFDGLDACVMAHPADVDAADVLWLGRRTFTATFRGETAHASSSPWSGRNALDAASLAYQGIGVMRQQMPPSDKIHAIISDGGDRASIIPGAAVLAGYARSAYPETLLELSARVDQIMQGAALMANVAVEVEWDEYPPSMPVRNNQVLAARWSGHQQTCGRKPYPHGVLPDTAAASTDFGNVSCLVPAIHPLISIAPAGTAWHTSGMCVAANSPQAEAAIVDGAYGLAATALDFLADDDLARAAGQEFAVAGGQIKASELLA